MSVLLTASMYRELIVAESRVYRASVGMPNALDIVVNRSLLASMAKAGVAYESFHDITSFFCMERNMIVVTVPLESPL